MNGPYREPAPAPTDPYAGAWKRVAWRRRVLRGLVLVVLFAFVAPALSFAAFVDGHAALIAMAVTLAIPAALLVLSVIPPVACPCCERAFFSSAVTAMGTRTSCSSCGVVIGTPASQALVTRAVRVTASAVHPSSRLRLVVWLGCGRAVGDHRIRDWRIVDATVLVHRGRQRRRVSSRRWPRRP